MSSSSSPPPLAAATAAPPISSPTTNTSTNLAPENNNQSCPLMRNELAETDQQQPQYINISPIELNGGASCRQQQHQQQTIITPNLIEAPSEGHLGAIVENNSHDGDNNCPIGNATPMQTTATTTPTVAKSTPLVRANMMTIMMEPPDTNSSNNNINNNNINSNQQQQQLPFIYQTTMKSGQQQQQQQKQLQVKGHRHQHTSQLQPQTSPSPSPVHQRTTSSVSPSSVTNPDTRTHVVGELYDTERSYVESLQILTEKYMKPLKSLEGNKNLIETNLVDEIFYTIPEILQHHETFLGALQDRLSSDWDSSQVIGNVFIEAFTNQQIIDIYTAFINNWKNARHAIKVAIQAKPAFERFLEAMSREHRNKLTLDALLIMPVQRIPRYELLIKELIKHTPVNHPDHGPLIEAQKEIHELALKIDRAEKEMIHQEQLRDLESLIEGHVELQHPQRDFIRYDLVTISAASTLTVAKKERVLFLFCDLLIMTSVKKKVSRRSNLQAAFANSSNDISLLEGNKFKLLLRVSLDQIEIKHGDGEQQQQAAQLMQQQQQQQQQQHQIQLLTQQKQAIQELKRELETDLYVLQQMRLLNEKISIADHRTRLDMTCNEIESKLRFNLTNIEQQQQDVGGDINQAQSFLDQHQHHQQAAMMQLMQDQPSSTAAKDLYVIQSNQTLRAQDSSSCSSPMMSNLLAPNEQFPSSSSSTNIQTSSNQQQQQTTSENTSNTSLEFIILNSSSCNLQPAHHHQMISNSRDSSSANSSILPMTSGLESSITSNNTNTNSTDNQLAAQHETLVVTFSSVDRRQAFLQAFIGAKQQRFNLQQQQQQRQQQQQQQRMFSSSVTLRLSQSDSSPTNQRGGGDRRTRLRHQDEVVEPRFSDGGGANNTSRIRFNKPIHHQHSQACNNNNNNTNSSTIVHQMSAPHALNETCGDMTDFNNGYLIHESASGGGTATKTRSISTGQPARPPPPDCTSCLASSSNAIGVSEPYHQNTTRHHHHHHHHQLMHQPASHPALLSTFCCNEQHNNSDQQHQQHKSDQNNNGGSNHMCTKRQHSEQHTDRLCNLDETSSDLLDSSSAGSGYLTMLLNEQNSHQGRSGIQQKTSSSSIMALASENFEKSNLNNDDDHDQQKFFGQIESVYQSLKFTPKFLLSLPAMNFLNTQHPTLQFTCSTTREKFTVISEFKFNEMDNIVERRQTIRDVSGQLWLCMSNGYVSHVALISLTRRGGGGCENNASSSITPIIHSAGDICKSHINCAAQVRWTRRKSRPSDNMLMKEFSGNESEHNVKTRIKIGQQNSGKSTGRQKSSVESVDEEEANLKDGKTQLETDQVIEVAIHTNSPPVDIKTGVISSSMNNKEKHGLSESAPTTTSTIAATTATITRKFSNIERNNSTSSSTSNSSKRPSNALQRAQTPPNTTIASPFNKTGQVYRRHHHNSYDHLRNNQQQHRATRMMAACNQHKNRCLIGKQQHDNFNQTASYNVSRVGQHCHSNHHDQQSFNQDNHGHHHHHHPHNHHHHAHSHHHRHWNHHHHHHHHNHPHQHPHLHPVNHHHHHLFENRHHTIPLGELRRALERQNRITVDDNQADNQQQQQSPGSARNSNLAPQIKSNHLTPGGDNSITDQSSTADEQAQRLMREKKARSTTPPARFNTGQRSLRSARMLRHQASLKTSAILAKLVSGASRKSSAYLSKNKSSNQQQQEQQKSDKEDATNESAVIDSTHKQQQHLENPTVDSGSNSASNATSRQLTVPRMVTKPRLLSNQFNSCNSNLHTPIVSSLSSVSSLNSTASSLTVNSVCGSSLNRSQYSILNAAYQPWSSTTCCAGIGGSQSSATELNCGTKLDNNQSQIQPASNGVCDATNNNADANQASSIYNADANSCGGVYGMRGRSATVPCRAFCRQSSSSMDLECDPCPLYGSNMMQRLKTSDLGEQNTTGINDGSSYKVSSIAHDDDDDEARRRNQNDGENERSQQQQRQRESMDDANKSTVSSSLWLGCDNGTLIMIDCLSGNSDDRVSNNDSYVSADCGICMDEQESTTTATTIGKHQQQRRNLDCQNVHAEIELGSPVNDIRVYKDKMVFVALASGQLVVFSKRQREQTTAEGDEEGEDNWLITEPQILNLATTTSEQQSRSTASAPATSSKLCLINDKYLWYSHGKSIYVLEIETLKLETIIMTPIGSTTTATPPISIDQMEFASNLNGVWLSFTNCPLIQFYDVSSYKLIIELSLLEPINKILSYGNEILRQHKTACLRATSLLDIHNQEDDCNSLFIGTSAGIIIYFTIKRSQLDEFLKVEQQASKIVWSPQVVSLRHGHSGQVKFLHLIELTEQQQEQQTTTDEQNKTDELTTASQNQSSKSSNKTLCLISGGSGVDFYGPSENDLQLQQRSNGDEDCINHLMLWQLCGNNK